MDDRLTRRILDKTKVVPTSPVSRQIGKVTVASPLAVTIAGVSRTDCLTLDSYSPTIGDRVYILRCGQDPPLVIGAIS